MALIVHGATPSPFVRKVCVLLAEKGVEYTLLQPAFPLPPEFTALHPLRRMPVLQDTSLPEPGFIPDSSVICDFLENTQGGPKLYPADPYLRARALWYEEYADGGLVPLLGPGIFRERVLSRLLGFECNEEVVRKTLADGLPPMLDYLEAEVGENEFLVGGAFSIADIAIASPFVNLAHAGEVVDPGRWPRLAAYLARIHARPSFAPIIAREEAFFAKLAA